MGLLVSDLALGKFGVLVLLLSSPVPSRDVYLEIFVFWGFFVTCLNICSLVAA